MLTEDIKIEKKEKEEYEPLPKDVYQVQLVDIESKTGPTYDTRNKPEEEQEMETVLSFEYALLEGELRTRRVWANFVPTYLYISSKNGKNKLYRIIEALIGQEITPEIEATMDTAFLNSLIGKQCRVSVEPKTKNDKTFNNITDWLKANAVLSPLTESELKGNSDEVKVEDLPF